jgi:hypothetical protein
MLLADAPGGFLGGWSQDLFSVCSLGLGVIGLGLTLLGLWLTFKQARRAASAATAAKDAAERTLQESRRRFQTLTAHRLQLRLRETKGHITRGEWASAVMRLQDLVEDTAHMTPDDAIAWESRRRELREAATSCERYNTRGQPTRALRQKWLDLMDAMWEQLVPYHPLP